MSEPAEALTAEKPRFLATPLAPPQPGTVARLATRLEFATGDARPTGVIAHDLDGDKRDELIAVVRGPGAVQVWSGMSAGLREPPRPRSFAIGDFALGPEPFGDWSTGGPALVAVAPRADPALLLVDARRVAAGAGDPLALRLALDVRPRVIACGDLGRDGRPEVAIVTVDDHLLLVRDGAIVTRQPLDDTQATCAAFTEDGSALLIGFQGTRRVVRLQQAKGSLMMAGGAVELPGLPRRILELHNWNQSPVPLFAVAGGDDALWWLSPDLEIERTQAVGTVPIDLVDAGRNETRTLLALAMHGQTAAVLRPGDPAAWTTYAGQHPLAVTLGDFDGDGLRDAAVANGDAKRISLLFGAKGATFRVPGLSPSGRSPLAVAAGDLDNDGRRDAVVLCALDGTLRVHLSREGVLQGGESQGQADGARKVRLADLDRDGNLDAVLVRGTDHGARVELWFGDGKGRLWARAQSPGVDCGTSPGDLVLVDLDGDGRVEALLTDPDASRLVVVPIAADAAAGARLGEARAFDVAGRPVELAVLVRDGRTEIAAALGGPGRPGAAILRVDSGADGAIALVETQHLAIDEPARGIAAGDFDGDAQADLALFSGADASGSVRVHLSRQGGWQALAPLPAGLRPFALRAVDLDGDGRSDLVLSAQNSHHVNAWLSRPEGAPSFVRLPDLGAGTGPLDIEVADMDGDGVPELLVACAFSDEIAVLRLR